MNAITFSRTFYDCAPSAHEICAFGHTGTHIMKLGHLLHLSGMSRDTFNTLVRRQHVTFIDHGIEGDTSHDRYSEVHALALVTFARLRLLGLAPLIANEAVKASIRDIARIVRGDEEGITSNRCGIRYTHLGLFDHFGWPREDAPADRLIGAAYIDLRETWLDVQNSMKDLIS